MGNEPAIGLEHLIPANGGEYDLFSFGFQESTYEVKKDLLASYASGTLSEQAASDIVSAADDEREAVPAAPAANVTSPAKSKWNITPAADGGKKVLENELVCVEILQNQLQTCLGDDFYLVVHNRRVQMQLFIFARRELEQGITNIEKSSENTGFLHVFPNKGGINVSMSIDGTNLSFVSCHLAAHEGVAKCAQRNQSCYEILEGIRAGNDPDLDIAVQFHHTIWMGDMNYRTTFDPKTPTATTSMPPKTEDTDIKVDLYTGDKSSDDKSVITSNSKDELDDENNEDTMEEADTSVSRKKNMQDVFQQIKDCNYAPILAKDELNRELAANRVLMGFTAMQPDWNPTFKRKRHTVLTDDDKEKADYNPELYYDKKRMPSFTDRILYTSLPGFAGDLVPLTFESVEETDSSDHKPVFVKFVLNTHGGVADITVCNELKNYIKKTKKQIKMSSKHYLDFKISNLKGHNLSEMDYAVLGFGGKSDPYVRVTIDPPSVVCRQNSTLETKIIKNELNPDWGKEELSVVCWGADKMAIAQNVHILLSVWDWDLGNPHDLIGTCSIPMSVIIAVSIGVLLDITFHYCF
jgi:hypothetical protein